MLAGLRKAAVVAAAEPGPDLPIVLLFSLGGLTLSLYLLLLLHLLPEAMVDAMAATRRARSFARSQQW